MLNLFLSLLFVFPSVSVSFFIVNSRIIQKTSVYIVPKENLLDVIGKPTRNFSVPMNETVSQEKIRLFLQKLKETEEQSKEDEKWDSGEVNWEL
jgi:hypothetical protein